MNTGLNQSERVLPSIAKTDLRSVLGKYATGVAVVAARSCGGQPNGLTVNSFVSVSLDPPLVLWSIRKEARLMPIFRDASHWAISVLRTDQHDVASRFCAPVSDRFDRTNWREGLNGAPLIEGAIAWLECAHWQTVDGGDHLMLLGKVEKCGAVEGPPLVFHNGQFGEWCPK